MTAHARLKDRYTLDRLPLAHSGMADVWPARDQQLGRQVIVKFLNDVTADMVRRFRREALLTARLDHPGVPAIYDLGEHESRPFLVLQRINGITLEDLTEEEPLPVPWVAGIGAQICSVLITARDTGLVHRDLKPTNVMLERSGAIKVLDFGIAAILGDELHSRITHTGQSVGTAGYMAPEQILNEPVDHRTDLYGLGATLFHLLVGGPPADGTTTTTTMRRQLDQPPPRPSQERPDTPAELDDLVHALLADHPERRPADAADVYDVLAPMAADLPPLPGFVNEDLDAVRAYAAVVGRLPAPTAARRAHRPTSDATPAADEADRLFAEGRFRAAARAWRALAERHDPDDPAAIEWQLKAARTHIPLGEVARALRLLDGLLHQRARINGTDHPATAALREEIARLAAAHPTAR